MKIFQTPQKLTLSFERETTAKAKKSDSFVPDVGVADDCDGEEDAMPPRRRMVDPYFSCFFLCEEELPLGNKCEGICLDFLLRT